MMEEVALGFIQAPLQGLPGARRPRVCKQCFAQRRNRVVTPEPFGNRVGQHQGSTARRAHKHGDIQNPQMFALRAFNVFGIDQAGLGQVLVL
ncbi:hypothetical protein D3C84_583590 [compost metagenome]